MKPSPLAPHAADCFCHECHAVLRSRYDALDRQCTNALLGYRPELPHLVKARDAVFAQIMAQHKRFVASFEEVSHV